MIFFVRKLTNLKVKGSVALNLMFKKKEIIRLWCIIISAILKQYSCICILVKNVALYIKTCFNIFVYIIYIKILVRKHPKLLDRIRNSIRFFFSLGWYVIPNSWNLFSIKLNSQIKYIFSVVYVISVTYCNWPSFFAVRRAQTILNI